ncbi:sensor domain-containing phosphodiesterase [Salmonella enterica]|nr:sensor domain-containing phosphodiesterase [Salmonella enterica]EBQ4288879.1 sensor domain-containing phosphodiesterase [Salmonella enterica]EBQ4482833.1 sensor domain-containing phosphodiesterase [Salmonella enterica]EBQ4500356.1 sensor domain-containing phosphodiesterase [Salmonella enterica]ECC2506433.1 sensor domain-containing phosphodiesterase [Salmonella enterica]
MPDKCKLLENIKIFLLALSLTVPAILVSRVISPRATIDSSYIFLAWLPLCVMFAVLFLFGRRGVAPMAGGMMLTNEWNFHLPLPQAMVLLFCQTFPVLLACAIVRWQLGARWRYGIPNKDIWLRVFWLGLMTPLGIKISMHLAGHYLAFPVTISTFFGAGTAIFLIVDLLSLISAVLIFTLFFYYPMRMIVSPHYIRIFWRRNVAPYLAKEKRLFTLIWFATLATLLTVLCTPFETKYIAGYLVPVLFIGFTLGVGKISYPLLNFSWAITTLFLLIYNRNFLQGVGSEYSLAFILSVLISFSICLLYMARINQRSEWLNRQWHSRALTEPLTQLPNLRALEQFLLQGAGQSVCYLRMENLEFLSRHYGMLMRVHCEREVFRALQPLLQEKEKVFHLPGSELLLVLAGPETEARLQYMINVLNNRKIYWNNTGLEMEYGASWGTFDGRQETLQPLLGQLSWLAEQSCSHRRVLSLTHSIEAASGQTTERVLRLQKIRQALERGALVLYAQPIRDAQGKGYDEILTRLRCDEGIMMPNQFIPLIAQFNLSVRFDMQVVEALLQWLSAHPSAEQGARFSVNLMPLTLLQKETAPRIIQLFKRYGVPPASVIIEVTEEQAFSHSEISMYNITQLRKFGLKIAIDDFGTGYANYERLKRLKADIIKIDGCFVKDILTDSLDAMIVKSITDLAKAKSLSVVAEFVETPEQRDLLLQLGVHSLQGYLIGRPRPLGEEAA